MQWYDIIITHPHILPDDKYFKVPQSELDSDTVKGILSEYKIHNADITLKYDATSDDLIDVIEGNRIYVPCIYLLNKIGKICDMENDKNLYNEHV